MNYIAKRLIGNVYQNVWEKYYYVYVTLNNSSEKMCFFENKYCVTGTEYPSPKFFVLMKNEEGQMAPEGGEYVWKGNLFQNKAQFCNAEGMVIRTNPLIKSLPLKGLDTEIKSCDYILSNRELKKSTQFYKTFVIDKKLTKEEQEKYPTDEASEKRQYYYVTGTDGWYQFDSPEINDKSGSQIYPHGLFSNSQYIIEKHLEQEEEKQEGNNTQQEEDNKQQGDNKQEEDKQKVSTCYFFTDYQKESGGGVCGIYKKYNYQTGQYSNKKVLKVGYNQVTGSINGYYVQADSTEESENIIGSIVEDNKRHYIKKIEGKIYLFYKGFVGKTGASSIEQGKKYTFKDEFNNEKKIEISDENFVQGNQYKNCYYGDIATW